MANLFGRTAAKRKSNGVGWCFRQVPVTQVVASSHEPTSLCLVHCLERQGSEGIVVTSQLEYTLNKDLLVMSSELNEQQNASVGMTVGVIEVSSR